MQLQSILKFLICSTIPTVKDEKKRPEGVDENDWIWKCIYRAHRDVLTGRRNVKHYSDQKDDDNSEKEYNSIAYDLYMYIVSNRSTKNEEKITSRRCIYYLIKKYGEELTGAIQKLVNMSLKYLYLLHCFNVIDASYVDFSACDCPLDSIMLKTIDGHHDAKWTKIASYDEYNKIQDAINLENKLQYDFDHYYEDIDMVIGLSIDNIGNERVL